MKHGQRSWTFRPPQKLRIGKVPKIQRRVVLRGDVVKDDPGSYADFTEQRSSASHMTAARVLDVISRLARMRRTSTWCSIGLHSSENRRRTQNCWSHQNQSDQLNGFVHQDPAARNHGTKFKFPWYHSREIARRPMAGLLWERQFEKVLKSFFLSVHVDDIKKWRRKNNLKPHVGHIDETS